MREAIGAVLLIGVIMAVPAWAIAEQPPLVVGLSADMSSAAAQAGEAIRRGALLAIEEVNAGGGVLGRPLELVVTDHRGNPARGRDNVEELASRDDVVAILGGLHTPVALHELEPVHSHGVIYLDPWAAGTPIVDNGHQPNYVFRVSVRDEFAGGFLVGEAVAAGYKRPGLMLERTGWGRSNRKALLDALAEKGLGNAGVVWFNWGVSQTELAKSIGALQAAGADVLILVSNPREGASTIKAVAEMPEAARLPIISHWGIAGADFPALAGDALNKVDLSFLQTYSFLDPPFPDRSDRLVKAYCGRFGSCEGPRSIPSPAGTAHAYDLVHLLARAITEAGTAERAAVRDALERLGRHDGLMRDYRPPFTAERHDALTAADFRLARFGEDGVILPKGYE